MTSKELIRRILERVKRRRWLIFVGALLPAALMFIYASTVPVRYSVHSTFFPLTNSSDASSGASRINDLLGGGAAKSPSPDVSVGIEDVAKSRKLREAVVASPIAELGNRELAELIIEAYNKHRNLGSPVLKIPTVDSDRIALAQSLLQKDYVVAYGKTGLLEVQNFSTDPNLLIPVNYLLIQKISDFYRELKIAKARSDYEFTQRKVDSIEDVLNAYDRRRIQLNNTTLFVPQEKLQYAVPKENLDAEKARVLGQKTAATANREEALWQLQKVTPIVQVLDKPEKPFGTDRSPAWVYAIAGFALGLFLFTLLSIGGLLRSYLNQQVQTALQDDVEDENNVTTTA